MKKILFIYSFLVSSIPAIHAGVELTRKEYVLLCNQVLRGISVEKRALRRTGTNNTQDIVERQNKLEQAGQKILNCLNTLGAPKNQHITIITMTHAYYDILLFHKDYIS